MDKNYTLQASQLTLKNFKSFKNFKRDSRGFMFSTSICKKRQIRTVTGQAHCADCIIAFVQTQAHDADRIIAFVQAFPVTRQQNIISRRILCAATIFLCLKTVYEYRNYGDPDEKIWKDGILEAYPVFRKNKAFFKRLDQILSLLSAVVMSLSCFKFCLACCLLYAKRILLENKKQILIAALVCAGVVSRLGNLSRRYVIQTIIVKTREIRSPR